VPTFKLININVLAKVIKPTARYLPT